MEFVTDPVTDVVTIIPDPYMNFPIMIKPEDDESDQEYYDESDEDDYVPYTNPIYLALLHSDVHELKKALVDEKIDRTNINERVTGNRDLNLPPLHLAFISGSNTECIMALLDKGADLRKEDCSSTPIDLAIAAGRDTMLCRFIDEYKKKNPDALKEMLNKPTGRGDTPLHSAMLWGKHYKKLVQAMLDGGARALCTDDMGLRPSQICRDREVKSLLLDREMLEYRALNENTANNKRTKLSENDVPLSGSRSIWPSPAYGVVPAQNVAPPYWMQFCQGGPPPPQQYQMNMTVASSAGQPQPSHGVWFSSPYTFAPSSHGLPQNSVNMLPWFQPSHNSPVPAVCAGGQPWLQANQTTSVVAQQQQPISSPATGAGVNDSTAQASDCQEYQTAEGRRY